MVTSSTAPVTRRNKAYMYIGMHLASEREHARAIERINKNDANSTGTGTGSTVTLVDSLARLFTCVPPRDSRPFLPVSHRLSLLR